MNVVRIKTKTGKFWCNTANQNIRAGHGRLVHTYCKDTTLDYNNNRKWTLLIPWDFLHG